MLPATMEGALVRAGSEGGVLALTDGGCGGFTQERLQRGGKDHLPEVPSEFCPTLLPRFTL